MSERVTGAAQELQEIAERIQAWQEAHGLSMARLLREFRELGSDKTYRDLRTGRIEGYDLEKQLAAYRAVWAEIEARDEVEGGREEIYADLSMVRAVREAALGAMRSNGTNRVVLVTGDR